MSEFEVKKIVYETISRIFNVPIANIYSETTAFNIEGWDSVSNAGLYLDLEEQFKEELPIEKLLEAKDVGELCKIIALFLTRK